MLSSLTQFVIHLSCLELDGEENDKVLGEGENDKDDAQPNPENERADSLRPEEHHFGLDIGPTIRIARTELE